MNAPAQHASHVHVPEWLSRTAFATTGLIVAPYVLSLFGTAHSASEIMTALHGTGLGTGAAGALNGVLAATPVIGTSLAAGGLFTAATSGIIGFGGMWLGEQISRHEKPGDFPWGKVITIAALATSALIALPSILTGISVAITYFTALFEGTGAASTMADTMATTLGSTGAMNPTGLLGLAPHLLTCGLASLPILSTLMQPKPTPQTHAAHYQGALRMPETRAYAQA
jgi:hypothetical protein